MSKITINLDTETKELEMMLDGQKMDVTEIFINKYSEGFDFRANLKCEEIGEDVKRYTSIIAYAKEFVTKSFASVKFIDEKNTIAIVTEKKSSEKLSDWIKEQLK